MEFLYKQAKYVVFGKANVGQISSKLSPLELCSGHFLGWLGGLNKDATMDRWS